MGAGGVEDWWGRELSGEVEHVRQWFICFGRIKMMSFRVWWGGKSWWCGLGIERGGADVLGGDAGGGAGEGVGWGGRV